MLNHIVMWKIKEDIEDKEKVKLDIKNGLTVYEEASAEVLLFFMAEYSILCFALLAKKYRSNCN